jgi:Fe-S cluster assembly ATPase SufC
LKVKSAVIANKVKQSPKEIIFNDLSPDKRAKLGIFLAFQNIPEIQ